MRIGIVGLPNVGKSTLFKALTKIQVDISNYPFCTIEPNVGIVEVPDKRLLKVAEISKSRKKTYAIIEFVDIAGIVEGAANGQGLGNKFLHHIREADAIIEIVRVFENKKIVHVRNEINPQKDIEIISSEFILADIETTQKRIAKLEGEVKRGDKKSRNQLEITKNLFEVLNKGDFAKVKEFVWELKEEEFALVKDLHLLSFKPILYVFNTIKEETSEEIIKRFGLAIKTEEAVALDIKTEEEILSLTNEEKKELKLKSYLSELIKKSYSLLNLITFFTANKNEARAWTIPAGSNALCAARAVHSDFEEKFIRAEVIPYSKLIEAGGMAKAREKGLIKTVGKNYIVQDGDIIEFRI